MKLHLICHNHKAPAADRNKVGEVHLYSRALHVGKMTFTQHALRLRVARCDSNNLVRAWAAVLDPCIA